MIRQPIEQAGNAVGDGTSTATVLAHAIYAEGLEKIAAGASAIDLKRGLDRRLYIDLTAVKARSRSVESRRHL
jgi:chaperonin GroEL